MPIALNFLLMFFLASQTFPSFLGTTRAANSSKTLLFVLLPVATQILFFWLGFLVGTKFIYLMQGFQMAVIFIGFFIIGTRFMVDAFVVRKGKRTFQTENILHVILASIAQSTNTFLLGLLFCFYSINLFQTLAFLGLATLGFSFSSILSKTSKMSLAFSSFLFLLGGIFIIASSFYLTLF